MKLNPLKWYKIDFNELIKLDYKSYQIPLQMN